MKTSILLAVALGTFASVAHADAVAPGETLACRVFVAPIWTDGKPHAAFIEVPELAAQTALVPSKGVVQQVTTLDASAQGISYSVSVDSADGRASFQVTLDQGTSISGEGNVSALLEGTDQVVQLFDTKASYAYQGGPIRGFSLDCSATKN
jgi:hypothetical protein